MSGDRIVGLVAIAAMLILVVPGLLRRGLPAHRLIKLALIWTVVFFGATAIVLILA